jgi:hypothetical protein
MTKVLILGTNGQLARKYDPDISEGYGGAPNPLPQTRQPPREP